MFAFEEALPKGRKALRALAGTLVRPDRPGDYGQALMDLGATLCSPKNPSCELCPWARWCAAHERGQETDFPRKEKKKKTPIRYGYVYVLRSGGHFLVEQRPDKGLLGGMLGLPTSEWGDKPTDHSSAPLKRNWQRIGGIKHVFTHFELRLDVFAAEVEVREVGLWRQDISALPTVFKKAAALAHKKTGS